ncbi:MAG: CBASS oligonucleotide cyclase [Myxococcota bacterium]
MTYVTNATMASYIRDVVNLPADRESRFRGQVTYLRDRFQSYAAEHPTLSVKKLLGSGSLKKRTHNSRLNDIDIAAYVDAGDVTNDDVHEVNHAQLLSHVCDTLRAVYGGTKDPSDFEVRSTAVAIHFHGSKLDVDVVPVVVDHRSGCDEGWVLRGGASPLRTCIPRHAEFIRAVHGDHPGFREFVRLMKWWRTKNEVAVRSFLLELLAAHLCRRGELTPNRPLDAFEDFVDWIAQTRLDVDIWFDDWFHDPGGQRALPFVMDPVNPLNNAAEKMQEVWGPSQRLLGLVDAADQAAAALSEARAARTKAQAGDALAQVFGPSVKAVAR